MIYLSEFLNFFAMLHLCELVTQLLVCQAKGDILWNTGSGNRMWMEEECGFWS